MSTIAVVGATGRTGRIVVAQALARGYQVIAIARRDPSPEPRPGLTEISVDTTIAGSLTGLLDECDAVISAVGAADRRPTAVYSSSTAELIRSMKTGGRLLVTSSAGLTMPTDAKLRERLLGRGLHSLMRHPYADMARMEELLIHSDLRWTSVRPTRLTDHAGTGRAHVSVGAHTRVGPHTARADLASYLITAIGHPHTIGTAVAISS